MAWQGILGHDSIVELFRRALSRGRLASSFLFVGPPGVGKRLFALELAKALLCEQHDEEELQSCGVCPACQQVAASTHPDLIQISKPADKNFIPVETFVGDREHRMREGLCHDIGLKPFRGGRKIAIIDDADALNQEGANCLLKTLEEPPPRSVLILIGVSQQKQLPTIRSRCQAVRFQPLPTDFVAEQILERELAGDEVEAREIAELSGGSMEAARQMADPELRGFRGRLLEYLGQFPQNSVAFAKDAAKFVDDAGKEAPARRERMRLVVDMTASFYEQMMRSLSGVEATGVDRNLASAIKSATSTWPGDAGKRRGLLEPLPRRPRTNRRQRPCGDTARLLAG